MFAPAVTSRLRIASRLTVAALAAVLIFLGVFAVWSSTRSASSVSQLEHLRLISNAYGEARFATVEERLLQHRYMTIYGGDHRAAATPGLQAKLKTLSGHAMTALLALKRLDDRADRQTIARLLATDQAYQAATDRVWAAAATGNESTARAYESTVDRRFNQLNGALAKAADAHSRRALAQLNSLQRTERDIAKEMLVAVPLGLLLVGFAWLVIRAYRRRESAYTAAELARLKQETLADDELVRRLQAELSRLTDGPEAAAAEIAEPAVGIGRVTAKPARAAAAQR